MIKLKNFVSLVKTKNGYSQTILTVDVTDSTGKKEQVNILVNVSAGSLGSFPDSCSDKETATLIETIVSEKAFELKQSREILGGRSLYLDFRDEVQKKDADTAKAEYKKR